MRHPSQSDRAWKHVGAALLALTMLAGCGASDESDDGALAPLPITVAATRPDPDATVGPLTPVEVTEPCPISNSAGGGDGMLEESSRLEPMIGQVLAYGQAHADQFGSYGLVWHDGSDASVFISFTGDLERHRAALRDEVVAPDELIVCQVAINGLQAQALQSQLARELAGRFTSVGVGMNGVEVGLQADQESTARELVDRYGDAVVVRVGAMGYPIDEAEDVCRDTTPGEGPTGVDLVPVLTDGSLMTNGAASANAMVTLSNAGATPMTLLVGTATAVVFDTTGRVVNDEVGLVADVGTPIELAPGASTQLPMTVSLASCRTSLGYVLPPGDYRLAARIYVDGMIVRSATVDVTLR